MTPETNDQNLDKPSPNPSRRRLPSALAGALLGAATLTGSLLLLGQTAGADTADATASEDSAEIDSAEIVEHDAVGNGDDYWDDEWADFDACLVDAGVITAEELAADYEVDGEFDEEFDGDWIEDGWFEGLPFVTIENGEHLTFIDFGDGDGTVTVEKVGDEITISTSGDVAEESIDLADDFALVEELDGEFEAWEAAFEECEHLAPEDGLDFDFDEDFEDYEEYEDDEFVDEEYEDDEFVDED